MSFLLRTYDPGMYTGWAEFDDRELLRCDYLYWPKLLVIPQFPWHAAATRLIVEIPQIYRPAQSKADPNDMVQLALRAGIILAYQSHGCSDVRTPTPREWKGTVEKSMHNRRVLKTFNERERAIFEQGKFSKTAAHNVLDACGVGLSNLERMA